MYKGKTRLAARLLSIVLAAGMSVSGVSVSALAAEVSEEPSQQETVVTQEAAEEPETVPAAEEEETEFKVIRTKRFSIKPMSVDEAILQMNLLEHDFYVFRDQEEDDSFAVVYRRQAGDYGLIVDSDED